MTLDEKAELIKELETLADGLDRSRFISTKDVIDLLKRTTAYLSASKPAGDVEKMREVEHWCDEQAAKLGAVDGYDYRSGQEAAYRHCALHLAALASQAVSEPSPRVDAEVAMQEAISSPAYAAGYDEGFARGEAAALSRLAAQEPVAWRWRERHKSEEGWSHAWKVQIWEPERLPDTAQFERQIEPLYAAPQPAPDVEWSERAHNELQEVSLAIGPHRWMDPPDGGDVSLGQQVQRMRNDLEAAEKEAADLRAQVERLKGALDDSQSLLTTALHFKMPADMVELVNGQIIDNRAALSSSAKKEG